MVHDQTQLSVVTQPASGSARVQRRGGGAPLPQTDRCGPGGRSGGSNPRTRRGVTYSGDRRRRLRWRMRGDVIGEREVRQLLNRFDLQVLHVYEGAREVSGSARDAVLEDLVAFYRGQASPYADFVVQESC